MKLFLIFGLLVACSNPNETETVRVSHLKILFIGNSLTYYNQGVDFHLKKLCDKNNVLYEKIESRTIGGAPLQIHWNSDVTQKKLKSDIWDIIILQESAYQWVYNFDLSKILIQKFDSIAKTFQAKTLIYQNWSYPMIEEDHWKKIDSMSQDIKVHLGISNVPIGEAWEYAYNFQFTLNLFDDDGYHPNLHGTFLNACLFYAFLFDKNPQDNKYLPSGITKNHGDMIKSYAWKYYQIKNS